MKIGGGDESLRLRFPRTKFENRPEHAGSMVITSVAAAIVSSVALSGWVRNVDISPFETMSARLKLSRIG
jgi:hypothetical protein